MKRALLALLLATGCDKGDEQPKPPPPPTEPTPTPAGAIPTPPTPAPAPATPAPATPSPEPAPPPKAQTRKDGDDTEVREEVARYAGMLATEGPNGHPGEMSKRAPGGDLGQQLTEVKEGDNRVTLGGSAGRGNRSGDPRVGTGTGPTIDGPGAPPAETAPPRVSFHVSTSEGDHAFVSTKLKAAYAHGIKSCARKAHFTEGKLSLQFVVNEAGHTTEVSAYAGAAAPDELKECVGSKARSWRFSPQKDSDGEWTAVDVKVVMTFMPAQ